MNEEMKYSKSIFINYKIIKETDILQFAKLIEDRYNDGDFRKEITIHFDDDSDISSSSIDIFKSDEFKRRKSIHIKMEYCSANLKNRLEINIYSSTKFNTISKVDISSFNKGWYDCVVNNVTTTISEIQPQCKLSKLDSSVGSAILPPVFAFFSSLFTVFLIRKILPNVFFTDEMNLIVCTLIYVISACLCKKIISIIVEIFPKVDFAFGPEFKNKAKKTRDLWLWIVGTMMIPLIMFVVEIFIK